MGDQVILLFPFDDPDNPEVVEVLANVPNNWKKYLKKKAHETKKYGRYVVANILYDDEYYFPESMKKIHEKVEKETK